MTEQIHISTNSRRDQAISEAWFVGIVSLGFVVTACILFAIKAATENRFNQLLVYLVYFIAVPILSAAAVYYGTLRNNGFGCGVIVNRWLMRIGFYLPAVVLLYGLWGVNRTLYHIEYKEIIDLAGFASSTWRFFLGCFAVILLIGYMTALRTSLRVRMPTLCPDDIPPNFKYVFLAIFILSLFKIDIGHDSLSYDPYTGPASAVVLGSIPLVDTFSQYGLNYLLLAAGLKVLPWSMYSASLIITLLDLVYYWVVAPFASGCAETRAWPL